MVVEVFNVRAVDGKMLYGKHWPAENPRALVVIVHGLGEHIGRYDSLAEKYRQAGMAVAGFDHPGHGLSKGKRGHIGHFEDLPTNLEQVLQALQSAHAGIPVFLHGHSLGGTVALHFGLRRPDKLHGIIATSPWIRLAMPDPAAKVALGRWMSRIWPSLTLPTGLDPNTISRIPEEVGAYKNDPLVHDKISAALGISILDAAQQLDRFFGEYPVPLLVMHGEADGLTSSGASENFAGRVQGDVSFRGWPGAFHELHNDIDRDAVFETGLAWMKGRMSVGDL